MIFNAKTIKKKRLESQKVVKAAKAKQGGTKRAPNKTVREVAQLSAQQAAKGRSFFEDYTKVLAGEKR